MAKGSRLFSSSGLLIVFLMLLQGCQAGSPLSFWKKKNNSPTNPPGTLIKAKATGLTEPNQYRVDLRWAPVLLEDSRAEDRTWILLRSKESENPNPLLTLAKNQTSAEDFKVESGAHYTYVLGFYEESLFVEKERVQITIPTDLFVSGTVRAPRLTEYNRIFLNSEGVIQAEGKQFQIIADELHSQGGTLVTAGDSKGETLGSNSEPTEIAVIQVNKAYGNLIVKAKGRNGLKGKTGARGVKGLTGPAGVNAELARLKPETEDWNTFPWPPVFIGWQMFFKCQNPGAINGGPGLPGYPGAPGNAGENGSNSPRVFIEALDAQDFTVSIEKIPGKGGEGGEGGAGGDGGDGGNPGAWDVHQLCPRPSIGPAGIQGPQGPKGEAGQDGQISPVCLKLNQKEDGECSQFFIKNGVVF